MMLFFYNTECLILQDSSSLLIMCGSCGSKVKPPSMAAHKLKFCKGFGVENCDDSINNKSNYTENKVNFDLIVLDISCL